MESGRCSGSTFGRCIEQQSNEPLHPPKAHSYQAMDFQRDQCGSRWWSSFEAPNRCFGGVAAARYHLAELSVASATAGQYFWQQLNAANCLEGAETTRPENARRGHRPCANVYPGTLYTSFPDSRPHRGPIPKQHNARDEERGSAFASTDLPRRSSIKHNIRLPSIAGLQSFSLPSLIRRKAFQASPTKPIPSFHPPILDNRAVSPAEQTCGMWTSRLSPSEALS